MKRHLVMFITGILLSQGLVQPALARTPNDPYYGRQWYLPQIGAEEAWDVSVGSSCTYRG